MRHARPRRSPGAGFAIMSPACLAVACVAVACVAVACSGGESKHQVTAPRPEAAVAPPAATPDAGVFAPGTPVALAESAALSYWTTDDERAGADKLALEDWAGARVVFSAARAKTTDEDRAARIELVLGVIEAHLGNDEVAAQHFAFARARIATLFDYIAYHEARSLWLAHHGDEALALAKKIDRDSIVGADAEILIGDLLRDANSPDVETYYRDYLARHPNGPFRSEARFRLGEALEHRARPTITTTGPSAIVVYHLLTVEDPLSPWAEKAKRRLTELKIPDILTGPEHLTRGLAYADAHRNPEAEAELTLALADPRLSAKDRCTATYHRGQSRFDERDRKGAAPLFDQAITACHTAGNVDLEVKASYQAGRSYAFFGDRATAIARYQMAQTVDLKHSYADDAMLREAEEWAASNDFAKADAVLADLPKKFPSGDTLAEAMWRIGFRAWRDKRYDDAIKWWNEQIRVDDGYDYVFGDFKRAEAQYWIARAYAAKNEPAKAIDTWIDVVHQFPGAYYSMLALNRIREAAPDKYAKLVAEISADPPGFDPAAPAFTFAQRPEWGAPGFGRAMELLRLGLGEPAAHELKRLGLTAPSERKPITDPDKIDKLWAMAFLMDRAGRYATSHNPTRWQILDYRKQWPVGANRARWQIAYPKAYFALLSKHAELNHVPIAMQIGIVREESGFDPLDESYANAVGLTQMIPTTAHDFAKGTGIDPTRENLRDPEMNVTIGSRFLGSLFKDWNDFVLLVPTSYNAGPGYVRRNLRARGTWDADAFVEGILDDQARNYTKRVLGTFFTYAWLYEHRVPEIPNRIPPELIPKK